MYLIPKNKSILYGVFSDDCLHSYTLPCYAGAGNLEIIVAVSGRNVPNYVQSEGNARFKVSEVIRW